MRTSYFFIMLATLGLLVVSCKKESTSPGTAKFTSQQVDQIQNNDTQDALADKTDQDIDKAINQLQVSNYQTPVSKQLSSGGSLAITVNYPDSTTFPKVVTLVYTNFQDSTAVESFVKNGEIQVIISAGGPDKQLVTWSQLFNHFSVTTDSTTFTVSGTRTVVRTAHSFKYNGLQGARFTATDNISANLSYAITKTSVSDTLTFTRNAARMRNIFIHYDNFGGILWRNARLRNDLSKDTISLSGTVTGINEDGESYSKTVSVSTPLVIKYFAGTPVIVSGVMEYSVTGTIPASYTVDFREDPTHPRFTQITASNNANNEVYVFDRRFGRIFRRWW